MDECLLVGCCGDLVGELVVYWFGEFVGVGGGCVVFG